MKISYSLLFLSYILRVNGYTWPSPAIDELEDIMFLQSGYFRRGFHDAVLGCTFSPSGSRFRQASAEWLRTAFHDAITHDSSTGTGGLDASLRYELDRPENVGSDALNSTFGFMSGYQTLRSSMADLLALGVYTAEEGCKGPGESSVPEPSTSLEETKRRFEKAGFGVGDMITMVACGHTIGGVHGKDFPEITGNDSTENFPRFDGTTAKFDNAVATEYISGNTTNVLIVGPDATNSDRRIFSADSNVTMKSLTDPDTFKTACANILQRMIDTVPSSVTLTDPIEPIDVKPTNLKLYMTNDGTMKFEGQIRIRWTERSGDPPPVVRVRYAGGIIEAQKATFQGGVGLGFDNWFQFYEFQHAFQPNSSFSSFTVEFNDEVHTNGGGGFPIQTDILAQYLDSCLVSAPNVPSSNLTLVAAIRQGRAQLSTYLEVAVKKFQMGIMGAAVIEKQTVVMQSTGRRVGGYEMFSASMILPQQSAFTTYDVVNGDARVEFQKTASVPPSCVVV
ncbi:hypothetical protein VNI00_015072 [Paramarasmius palmivorus]|uniref:Peroxidase n=1 Tax=Paramarasmius palmivorus TaxID=297713 RepID=A0AAW0BNY2_9AGAR